MLHQSQVFIEVQVVFSHTNKQLFCCYILQVGGIEAQSGLFTTSHRSCEVWLRAWWKIREIIQLKQLQVCKSEGNFTLRKHSQLLTILSTPTHTLATLSTSRTLWIKSCDSIWRQDLNADAKARPYSSFFSREFCIRFTQPKPPPSRCALTNCRELVLCSMLGDPCVLSKKYHFSSNFQQYYYQVLNSKSQMEA